MDTEIEDFKCELTLWLDGYDTQKEHDEACIEMIEESLDISSSSLIVREYNSAEYFRKSELKEWCEKEMKDDDSWLAHGLLKTIIDKFCKGV